MKFFIYKNVEKLFHIENFKKISILKIIDKIFMQIFQKNLNSNFNT